MNLKKILKSSKAQAVLEYVLIYAVVILAVLVAFGSFNPNNLLLRGVIDTQISRVVDYINVQK